MATLYKAISSAPITGQVPNLGNSGGADLVSTLYTAPANKFAIASITLLNFVNYGSAFIYNSGFTSLRVSVNAGLGVITARYPSGSVFIHPGGSLIGGYNAVAADFYWTVHEFERGAR